MALALILLGAVQCVRFQGGAQWPQDPLATENVKRKELQ